MPLENKQTVVITGSAGGLGAGMARAFYRRGFNVVISDVNEGLMSQCVRDIAGDNKNNRMLAMVCDVTDPGQVQNLWQQANNTYNTIHYWINNAGLGGTGKTVAESDLSELNAITTVNINGVINGTHVAVNSMQEQGVGKIYNIAGFGENGYTRRTMVPYGTTKRAVGYFSRGVAMELADSGISLGWINPGMVITPLVINRAREMGEQEWRKQGRVMFRLFGQRPDECGEILVEKMIADSKNGTFVKLLPGYKILLGFFFNWMKKDKLLEFGI